MEEKFAIAGYCRISVDEELDRDNTSIENQKSIIRDYVGRTFPGSTLDFYEDRDRSGYTFEQREAYQRMRPLLMAHKYDILIVKDFSRFSRRNSRGLVELEDLRDAGLRIIAIGDSIDYPTNDDWTAIQFRFLVNEMPVTDASKKVRSVIKRRQEDGKWICAVPYGYVITNTKTMTFEVDPAEAEVVRDIYRLYTEEGWGYKRIAMYLTDKHIPTPRMDERARHEANGDDCRIKVNPVWSIATVQGILTNDFYIGTLRQGKYTRKKINGSDTKREIDRHIVFENNHEPIIDYRTFATAAQALKSRSTNHYRGVKKYANVYSGLLVCGDCGSPMFPMSRKDLKEAYRCGTYHKMGLRGCTSHHIRADVLDQVVRSFLTDVRFTCADTIDKLQKAIVGEADSVKANVDTVTMLTNQLEDAKEEKRVLVRQCAREIMRHPDRENSIQETYDDLVSDCEMRIAGIEYQLKLTTDKQNTLIRTNRLAEMAINIFDEVLNKDRFDKNDLELIIDKIVVFDDHIEVKLKADIDCIIRSGALPEEASEEAANFEPDVVNAENTVFVQRSAKRRDKIYGVRIISDGDPLEIFTDRDGEVIFKKYSPIGELLGFASQYADTLYKTCSSPIIICDRDTVVAFAGLSKKDCADKKVAPDIESVMESRQIYCYAPGSRRYQMVEGNEKINISCAMPIIAEGDVIGAVATILPEGTDSAPTDVEMKLIQTAAVFLGKQLEE